jgi:serine/threonine-protein kinase
MRAKKSSLGARYVAGIGVAMVLVGSSHAAHAQGGNAAAAEALFAEGRRLVNAGDFANACPKFADSERLDPSVATLLNLGACYEKAGRTASAWATFRAAISAAQAAKRDDYLSIAQKRATALEPTLSRVVISEKDTTVQGIEIKRDGVVVTQAEWGVPIPVDPGAHLVEASAPSKKPWQTTLTIAAGAAPTTVEIPALEDAPAPPPAPTPVAPVAPTPMDNPTPATEEPAHDTGKGSSQRTAGVVVGVVGIVGLGVGTAFVFSAKSSYDDSLTHCPTTKNVCDATGVSERDSARTSGNFATAAYGIGAAALATGLVLWFTAPSSHARVGVVPAPGGALIRGEF